MKSSAVFKEEFQRWRLSFDDVHIDARAREGFYMIRMVDTAQSTMCKSQSPETNGLNDIILCPQK